MTNTFDRRLPAPDEQWPLRRLNLIVIPIAVLLAIRATSFGWSLVAAAVAGLGAALILAMLWVRRLRAELRRIERTNPLAHLNAQIQGAADAPLQVRFVLMQGIAGALIASVWFALAFGVVALLT